MIIITLTTWRRSVFVLIKEDNNKYWSLRISIRNYPKLISLSS